MKKILFIFFLISITCKSFSQEKQILDILEQQRKDWNNGDIPAFMQGYLKSDSLMFVGKTGATYGWQNTLNNYEKGYPDKAAMGYLTFGIKKVKMLDKKHALVLGSWHLKRDNDEPQGYFTLIFEKFGKKWKIIFDHSS